MLLNFQESGCGGSPQYLTTFFINKRATSSAVQMANATMKVAYFENISTTNMMLPSPCWSMIMFFFKIQKDYSYKKKKKKKNMSFLQEQFFNPLVGAYSKVQSQYRSFGVYMAIFISIFVLSPSIAWIPWQVIVDRITREEISNIFLAVGSSCLFFCLVLSKIEKGFLRIQHIKTCKDASSYCLFYLAIE